MGKQFYHYRKSPIPGYQPLKAESFTIEINQSYNNGKYLGCTFKTFVFGGNTNGTFADGNVITLQYFPTAVVKILTTDADNNPLADAFFDIIDTSTNKVILRILEVIHRVIVMFLCCLIPEMA